jgi:hypothetical protein
MRVAAVLRGGALVVLPVPLTGAADAHVFEQQLSRCACSTTRPRGGAVAAMVGRCVSD